MKKRVLSMFLCILLCLSLFSVWAFAEGEELNDDVIVEEEIVTENPVEEEVVEENNAEEDIVEEDVTEPDTLAAAEESQDAAATASFQTTLNMADFTGIFVYIDLPAGADASQYTIETTGGSYIKSFVQPPVAVSTLEKGSGSRADMYQFEALRAGSPEMTDEVTVILKKGNQVVTSESYSVYGIAEAMLERGGLTNDQVYLLKGLLQYGYYGHIMFRNPLEFNPVIDGAPSLTDIPSSYAAKGDPTGFGSYVTKFVDKLNLDSVIAMNLYLTLANGYSMNDFTFSVLDQNSNAYDNYTVNAEDGNQVSVKIGGIMSPQMAKKFTLVVTLKSDPSKTAFWTRSVWTCAYEGSGRTSGDGVKFLQALYQYGVYAQKQFPGASDPDPTTAAIGDLVYEFNGADTCGVKTYSRSAASLTVPATVPVDDPMVPPVFRGASVTEIGPQAFQDKTSLNSIDLPDSITLIAYRAFAGCTNLSQMS